MISNEDAGTVKMFAKSIFISKYHGNGERNIMTNFFVCGFMPIEEIIQERKSRKLLVKQWKLINTNFPILSLSVYFLRSLLFFASFIHYN